ncbi:ORF6C domain-containing protein [Lactobacillus taiwanensis]|uniref:ORF6C domain-containing protein n=1 Tax=Lactobacillus TaxID=1578 RepID=UPI00189FCBCF|nr:MULTISPECIES: ORF6C domain-containing protein [Lactobacillus]MCR1904319.1 ORF6C domain-containing protein [Lactobacillus taiwanensis]
MEDKIQSFEFEGKEVRTLKINDEPWFVGKDLATILGYSNTRDALNKHVDSEDKNTVAIRDGITRGNPNQTIVNESGMFSLILSSNLPNAKKFKRWVTSEVLPTIRKTGSYHLPQTPEELLQLTMKATNHLDERVTNVEEDIDYLKNKSEVDENQRYKLQKARNKRCIEVCGGKKSNFYKTKSRKTFMALAHDFKEYFQIPRYDALHKEDFDKAIEFINGWYPSVLLKRDIDEVNAQTNLDI